ncbi:hypothetical protein [Spirosoma sp.]|uniref:hypothetical protein n=1 Tax=Spirosoma sp. TaxID=1899569 RepID=UPI0026076D79|nr:hypothetical protein [Spirosoma sp.]MCX6217609.1 hypothetical protein [Spirosoma sp.]
MAIITANITAGAYNLSEQVTVSAAVTAGSTVVVYRGEFLLGSGLVSSGQALVAVPPLATGDIIQASVTERGNQSGIPVMVSVNPILTTGWLDPDTLLVTNADGSQTTYTVANYIATFGETPGSYYDPMAAGLSQLPADYDKKPVTELGFDVQQVMQAGSTVLRVIPRGSEGLLVGWNGATPGSPAPLTVTTSATVTVSVIRDDDPTVTRTRSISVSVLPAPTSASTPAAGDIIAASFRVMNTGGYIRAMVNSSKPCEGFLVGYSSSWIPGTFYGYLYQEIDWTGPVPTTGPITYTVQVRVIGETNPANYTNFLLTF